MNQDYTDGLTLWQHNVIKRYVRERLEKDVDIIALCRAKREIHDIVARDWAKVKTSRVRMARFRNEGVQHRREAIEATVNEAKPAPELPGSVAGPLLLKAGDLEGSDYRGGVSDLGSAITAHSKHAPDRVDGNVTSTPAVTGGIVKGAVKKTRRLKREKSHQAQPPATRSPRNVTAENNSEVDLEQDNEEWATSYDLRVE